MVIRTERLLLRRFRESDYDDLFEFLSQLEDDEFEGYPGITYENGKGICGSVWAARPSMPSCCPIPGR